MNDTYTIVLDVNGGTYVDQRLGSTPAEALRAWAKEPHDAILFAFGISSSDGLVRAVEADISGDSELIVAISGLQSVWFVSLEVNEITGFINLIRTKVL